MRNGYILLTEVLMELQKLRGRMLQIEGRLGSDKPGVARSAVTELAMVREDLNRQADTLVEVQAMFDEPTKSQIALHYNPDAKDMPMIALDPADLMGLPTIPGPGKSTSFAEQLVQHSDESLKAILSMEEGPVGFVDDKRPAGWTEALALEFIVDYGLDEAMHFAKLFVHGQWPEIQGDWPEFQTFVNKQLEGRHAD